MRKAFYILICFSCTSLNALLAEGAVLKVPLNNEPPTLDWNIATDNVSFRVITQIMEGLTYIDEKGAVRPALAEKWKYYPEGPSYVFYLRRNVTWSDGKPFESSQVVSSFRRLLSPETGSPYAYFAYDIKNARCFNEGKCRWDEVGVKNPSKYKVVFYLEKPAVYFPYIPSFMVTYPIREDVIKKRGDFAFEPPFPVIGPFVPVKWVHHYKLVLEPNVKYYRGAPQVEGVEMYVVEEPLSALLLFETGALHMALLFPLAYEGYRNDNRLREVTVFRGYYYGFNIEKEPLNHVELRKALAYATSRRKVARSLRGMAEPAVSWIPPGMMGYSPDVGLKYDPEKAKKYLKSFYRKTGRRNLTLTIYFNASYENQVVAENISHQWREVLGINVKLEMMEWNAYLQMLEDDPPPIFRLGWGADYPDPDNFMKIFTSWSGNNHTGWKNPMYDSLILRASAEMNPKLRAQHYRRAQMLLLNNDVVILPLFFSRAIYLKDPCWENLELTSMDILYLKDVQYVCTP